LASWVRLTDLRGRTPAAHKNGSLGCRFFVVDPRLLMAPQQQFGRAYESICKKYKKHLSDECSGA
jgi:hypothetical protein